MTTNNRFGAPPPLLDTTTLEVLSRMKAGVDNPKSIIRRQSQLIERGKSDLRKVLDLALSLSLSLSVYLSNLVI